MKIAIIGAGAMGGAMAEGLLQSEKFIPSDITVSDHNQPVLDHLQVRVPALHSTTSWPVMKPTSCVS